MANTFFDFDSSLNNGDHLLPPDDDDCIENEEEEYDALNDETFGALEDNSIFEDDWEQQHEQFAEIDKTKKQDEEIENSISRLVLDDSDRSTGLSLTKNSVWAYTPPAKNGDNIFNSSVILSSLQKASKSFIETHSEPLSRPHHQQHAPLHHQHQHHKIPTVEELEKNLLKSPLLHPLAQPKHQLPHPHHPQFHPLPPGQRLPPGFGGMPSPVRHLPLLPPPPHLLRPGLMQHMMQPPPFIGAQQQQQRHPAMMYPPFNFQQQQPMRVNAHAQQQMMQMAHAQQQQQQQRMRNDSFGRRERGRSESGGGDVDGDEYAGLMSNREKQWLLNIQMLQLNTGTPYFDDYYYTVFKEKKAKMREQHFGNEHHQHMQRGQGGHRYGNGRQRGNSERGDNNNTLTPRVYTPLQFENSLGKLQCGSVTAPRKIIDMDIVTPDKDGENTGQVRDTRKTKQLLLELETLFTLLLKAEDLRNPLALSNMDKLREIKQKQRLRELELAPTPEQKQEVLKLLKQDSELPIVENQYDYIVKIVNGLMQEEKFVSFLNIRKGKMLLLRLLPHLSMDQFGATLLELWQRILLSLAIVGRRDTSGDQILAKLQPFFKRFVQTCTMTDVLEIVNGMVEVIKQENSRSTPLGQQGKAPLYFILLHKFGVSALVTLVIRTEYLISSGAASEEQRRMWCAFLQNLADVSGIVSNRMAQPIESIPKQIFLKHCMRFVGLSSDKKSILEKHFVDLN